MSLPRPSGLKAPGSKIGRPSGLPTVAPTAAKSGIPPPSGIPSKAQSPESDTGSATALDDYKIGDRVWVSGTKPGIIAFIGETQFAPGEWAGVVLDTPIGKNDGSVMGVRYFQCEMKRGVFSRLTKLTRTMQAPRPELTNDSSSNHSMQNNSTNGIPAAMSTSVTSPPHNARPTTPRLGLGGSHAPSGSSSSLHKATSPTPHSAMNAAAARAGLKIGDRVLVSGSKPGVLRYVGETDFAKGTWAGVELDEALGKNDGAVAGKRYFDCKALHGLFAPVHKVTRVGGTMSLSTPSPMSRSLGPGLRSARERSGSQESVSSISSSASSVSRSRNNKAGQRPSSLNLSATTAALQKALKEKEEHIEQLLRERDLERSEVARAAAQVDEAEGQLSTIKSEQERFRGDAEEMISRLRGQIGELEKEKEELNSKLEDEQRRVEDLQFQIEEEVISKDDLETTKEEDEMRLRELEKNHSKEKKRADNLEKELEALKIASEAQQSRLKEQNSSQTSYMEQVEELTHKLSQAENRIKQFENCRQEQGAKANQVNEEMAEKSAKISELEDLVNSQRKDLKHTEDALQDVREELTASSNRCKKLQESVDALTSKLQSLEANHTKTSDELRTAKSQSSDLQRQLAASKEMNEELSEDRNKLEQQITELMRNSGDSSNQLSALNQQLAEKTRKAEELQSDLSSSSQQIAKLKERLEEQQFVQKREQQELVHNFEGQLKSVQSQLEDKEVELERWRSKLTKVTEDGAREREEEAGRREMEMQQLRDRLQTQAEESQQLQAEAQTHRDHLDSVGMELETVKFEKEKAEKAMKRLEAERDEVSAELIQTREETSQAHSLRQAMDKQLAEVQEQLEDLQADKERLTQSKLEAEKQREDLKGEKEKVIGERDGLRQQWVSLQAEMQKRDIQMEEMQKEIERLRKQSEEGQEEMMQRSQTEADMVTELEGSKKNLEVSQQSLKDKESELLRLKADLEMSKLVADDRKKLEVQREELMQEMEQLRESHRQQLEAVETERVTLSNRVNSSQQELHQQRTLLEQQRVELASLEAERQELKKAKSSLEKHHHSRESETKALAEKVTRLELALAQVSNPSSTNVAGGGESREAQLLQDRDTAQQQVDFLNSVIVDLQRKNEEVEHRLQAMESMNEAGEPESLPVPGRRSRPAPRLFCDICDVFDLHDTDDCPKQAMSDSPPPSSHHGDRHSVRPYCDICEYFIDPDAAEKHAHSKQLDAFFRQHVGFFSDDEAMDDQCKDHRQGRRRKGSSHVAKVSPSGEGPHEAFNGAQEVVEDTKQDSEDSPTVPCLVLSGTESSAFTLKDIEDDTQDTETLAEDQASQENEDYVDEPNTEGVVHQQTGSALEAAETETEAQNGNPLPAQQDLETPLNTLRRESEPLSKPKEDPQKDTTTDTDLSQDEDFADAEQEHTAESSHPDFTHAEDTVHSRVASDSSSEVETFPPTKKSEQLTSKGQSSDEAGEMLLEPAAKATTITGDLQESGTAKASPGLRGTMSGNSVTEKTPKEALHVDDTAKCEQAELEGVTSPREQGNNDSTTDIQNKQQRGENQSPKQKADDREKPQMEITGKREKRENPFLKNTSKQDLPHEKSTSKGEKRENADQKDKRQQPQRETTTGKGDKQEAAKKRASTGATQGEGTGPSTSSGEGEGSDRPESCVVS